jgi:hypothetical protein
MGADFAGLSELTGDILQKILKGWPAKRRLVHIPQIRRWLQTKML